ncbi:hypothetical protein GMI70_05875 [Eggerthellaceae bacterium zg-893]|nr:hypothetical protein [Eggerthellaceae bacterium zg-893]
MRCCLRSGTTKKTTGSTMTLSKRVELGSVWLTYLHYSDLPDLGKVRPVLIVEVFEDATAVVLKITSKAGSGPRASLAVEDWASCGLRKPSYIRVDEVFRLSIDDLLRDEPLGSVGPAFLEEVRRALKGMEKA